MEYPTTPEDKDLRKKLLKKDIEDIRLLYNQGMERENIAEKFDVTVSTIRYWTDEEYRMNNNERTSQRHLLRMRLDSNFRNKTKRIISRSMKRKRKIVPELKKYFILKQKEWESEGNNKERMAKLRIEWQKEHPERCKQLREEYRKRNHNRLLKKERDWRKDNKDFLRNKAINYYYKNREHILYLKKRRLAIPRKVKTVAYPRQKIL